MADVAAFTQRTLQRGATLKASQQPEGRPTVAGKTNAGESPPRSVCTRSSKKMQWSAKAGDNSPIEVSGALII